MIKNTKYDNLTHQNVTTTERTWVASNGHTVKVVTRKSIDTNTINSRLYRFNTTTFKCECGKGGQVTGGAHKSELDNHDSWMTQVEHDAFLAKIMIAWG
jgi:hypothetical protein